MAKRGDKRNKNRKYDRNRKWCEAYRKAGTRERNKVRRIKAHLKRHPNDRVGQRALARYS